MNRFDCIHFDDEAVATLAKVKEAYVAAEKVIDELPESRGKRLAYTKLEESYMWAGKAIRDAQARRSGSPGHP